MRAASVGKLFQKSELRTGRTNLRTERGGPSHRANFRTGRTFTNVFVEETTRASSLADRK